MKISELYIYPVKSLRGIRVACSELTQLGLKFDRHWMIVDDKNQFVTQRKRPKMVLIQTKINSDYLCLMKEGLSEFRISLDAKASKPEPFRATIWQDECLVIDEGIECSKWITTALESKKPLRLVRMAPSQKRPQSQGDRFGFKNTTQFADAVSYLICHQTSLDVLNKELIKKGFSSNVMEQFRPNIVIANTNSELDAFQEHQVKMFKNDNYSFVSRDPCQRCIMPTINIQTGEKDSKQEPYKTLVTLNPMPDNLKAPAFGQNATLVPESNGGIVNVGDDISVVF